MATIDVTIEGGRDLEKAIRAAGDRALDALAAAMFQEAEAVMADSKREVPVDEGTLRASGFVDPPKKEVGGVSVTMGYGGAAKGYAVFLHEGTGPAAGRPAFFPPVEPIAEWATRKGIDIDPFVLARAIGRKGLTPRKFLEAPLRRKASGMGERLARRVRATLS